MKPTDPEDSLLDAAALAQVYVEEVERDYDSAQRQVFVGSSSKPARLAAPDCNSQYTIKSR